MKVQGYGFRVWGSAFQASTPHAGFRVSGLGLRLSGFDPTRRVSGFGFGASPFRLRPHTQGSGFGASPFRLRPYTQGSGFSALPFGLPTLLFELRRDKTAGRQVPGFSPAAGRDASSFQTYAMYRHPKYETIFVNFVILGICHLCRYSQTAPQGPLF